ncbi:MAG: hypothetical protein OQJ97_15365 [Rhodospirillales bacterium]|nr:hypothetical protein [Rhodospirillales bacterium]
MKNTAAPQTLTAPQINDTESYRAANLLIKQFGENAPDHAKQWITEMKLDGDDEGAAFWIRVLKALDLFLSNTTPPNVVRH